MTTPAKGTPFKIQVLVSGASDVAIAGAILDEIYRLNGTNFDLDTISLQGQSSEVEYYGELITVEGRAFDLPKHTPKT